ncbi:MAG: ABC transporter substrate-binding protein, partial [Candidatus Desulfofervidaceae bacterium]|nr:ABC transporter substrate-binding protein [Candidatus Desulfofervidaceae bacterium]
IGYVGTPTTVKILDVITKAKIPLIGPFTGAHQLRLPYRRYVFNVRNSYWAETEALVEYAVETLKKDKIAVFYQNDAYGLTGYKGTVRALAVKYNKSIVAEAVYTRGQFASKQAIDTICQAKPEVVIMIGTYGACSDFIKRAKAKGLNAVFMNISFVGPSKLAGLLGPAGNGVIVSQVVPPLNEEGLPAVKEYKNLMKRYFPEKPLTFVGLEGFIDAKVIVEAIKRCGNLLTRENLVAALENFNYDPGIKAPIDYSPQDREGLDVVYLTLIKNGEFKLVKKVKKQINLYIY